MPPLKYGATKKRRPRREHDYEQDHTSQSMPSTPSQTRSSIGILSENPAESLVADSDSECGFDSNWRPTYI